MQELVEDSVFQELVVELKQSISQAFDAAEETKDMFIRFQEMVASNAQLDIPAMEQLYVDKVTQEEEDEEGNKPVIVSLVTFRKLQDEMIQQQKEINALADTLKVGIIEIDCVKLKEALLPSPTQCLAQLHELLPRMAAKLYQEFIAEVHDAISKLNASAIEVEEYVEKIEFLNGMRERDKEMMDRCTEIQDVYAVVEDYAIPASELELAAYATLMNDYTAYQTALEEVESTKDENISRFSGTLETGIEDVQKATVALKSEAIKEFILDETSSQLEVMSYLSRLTGQLSEQQAEARRINKYQRLFKVQETRTDELDELVEEVNLKTNLWQGSADWTDMVTGWKAEHFEQLKVGPRGALVGGQLWSLPVETSFTPPPHLPSGCPLSSRSSSSTSSFHGAVSP